MRMSGRTDIGRRRSSNQDSYAIGELPDGGAWAVVCDGMGGHAGGNVASEIAVSVISEDIKSNFREGMSVYSVRNMLLASINSANISILEKAEATEELKGMGTTVVIAVCIGNRAVIAHVGDSRCCLISDGTLSRITKDHSLVQELVDAGYITESEAATHPQKNIITRALGIGGDVDIDFSEIVLGEGDMLLLCTDGLTNHVSDDEIIQCTSDADVFDYSDRLITLANNNGGSDNITAVVIAN